MRRFHRRRAKVGEFAHPFGAKRRPSASGWDYRANPSAASGLLSKVPNEAMISTHKTPIVPHEGTVPIYKTSIVPNDTMVSTYKTPIVPHEGTVLIHKSPIMPNEGMASTHKTPIVPKDVMVLIHKSPIMPNEGTALFLLVFGE